MVTIPMTDKYTVNGINSSFNKITYNFKSYTEKIKDLYKSLISIERIMKDNEKHRHYMQDSLDYAMKTLTSPGFSQGQSPAESFKAITEFSNSWLNNMSDTYSNNDFGHVFDLFIKN